MKSPRRRQQAEKSRRKIDFQLKFEPFATKKGRPRNPHPNRFVWQWVEFEPARALRGEERAQCMVFGSHALRDFGSLALRGFWWMRFRLGAARVAQFERVEECRPLFPAARTLTASGT
jgi:hypothetical protein